MAETRLEDVVIPYDFRGYVLEQSFADNALLTSGAFTRVTDNDMKGGYGFQVASWGRIPGRSHVIEQGVNLPVEALDTNTMTAIALARGKAVGFHDLVKIFSGQDGWGVLAQRFIEFWQEDFNEILASVLEGVFASAAMSGSVLDITGETGDASYLGRNQYINAGMLLRNRRSRIAAVVVDSYTEAYWSTLNAATGQPIFGQSVNVNQIGNATVVVDDLLVPAAPGGEHVAYLIGTGAGQIIEKGNVDDSFDSEGYRNPLASYSAIVQRRVLTPHVAGTSWVGTVGPVSPDNAELATGTNWTRVWDNRSIPIVQVRYRLPTD
jgi:hypothetical protein